MKEFSLTHVSNEEDLVYLRSRLFDVNIRLLKESVRYKSLVQQAVDTISAAALTNVDGYKLPHGMSGANLGIPWNIIAVVRNRGQVTAYADVFINPKILQKSSKISSSKSNCGSVRLPEPIIVYRSEIVTLSWITIDGEEKTETFDRANGSFTIQHEVEHNLGILITDHSEGRS